MSQNKTIIQGLEPEDSNFHHSSSGHGSSYYSRSNRSSSRGTVVPGMTERRSEQPVQRFVETPAPAPRREYAATTKPIVGFLYSISRTPMGEFWPLFIGPNTIGKSPDCDIILPEGTVSESHAVIVTRQLKSGIIAAITDSKSSNGTMINGEMIGFSAEECHDGDIITIGSNYEFVLLLVDANKRGLKVSENFIALEVPEEEDEADGPVFPPGTTHPGGFSPYGDGPTTWGNNNGGSNGGTVGMDGSTSGGNHGGTIPM